MSAWWRQTLSVVVVVAVLAALARWLAPALGYEVAPSRIVVGVIAGLGGWLLARAARRRGE